MFKQKLIVSALLTISCFSFKAFAQTPKKIKTIIVDAGHGGNDPGAHGAYEGGLNSYEKNITLAISKKLVDELEKQLPDVKIVPTRTTDIYQSPPEKADIANANKGDLFICIHADAAQLKTGSRITGYKTVTVYDNKVEWITKGKSKKKVKKVTKVARQVEKPIIQYYKLPTQRSGTSVWLFGAHKTSGKLKAFLENEDFVAQTGSDTTYTTIDFSDPEKQAIANINVSRFQKRSITLATYVNEEVEKTGREALGINQRQVGIWVLQATNMPAILVETGFITNYDDERYLNSEKGQQEIAEAITKAVKRYKEQIEHPKQAETPAANPN